MGTITSFEIRKFSPPEFSSNNFSLRLFDLTLQTDIAFEFAAKGTEAWPNYNSSNFLLKSIKVVERMYLVL